MDHDDLGRWLFRQDATGLREEPIGRWLDAHPWASTEACRAGWVAACDASARVVHGYRRAPWASGRHAQRMGLRQWRALVGWLATGAYGPADGAPAPLEQALAARRGTGDAGDE